MNNTQELCAGSGLPEQPALAGPTDPCTTFDHPNVSAAHTIELLGLPQSPAEGLVPLPWRGWRFWGGGARAMQRGRGRAQALPLAGSLETLQNLCLQLIASLILCSGLVLRRKGQDYIRKMPL